MEYVLYKCFFDSKSVIEKIDKKISDKLNDKLKIIESEIILEYLKKQKGRFGIKNLGNEIRYNKNIQNQFNSSFNNEVLLKITEHYRSFLYFFISKLSAYKKEDVYFLIISREFGIKSKIVDKSFPDIQEIKEQINFLSENFKIKNFARNIYFIEIIYFKDYIFEEMDKNYSKIVKIK